MKTELLNPQNSAVTDMNPATSEFARLTVENTMQGEPK